MHEIVIICNAKAIVKQNENDIMKITKEGYYYKCEIITKIFLKKGKKKKKKTDLKICLKKRNKNSKNMQECIVSKEKCYYKILISVASSIKDE